MGSIQSTADLFQRLFAKMLIRSPYNLAVFLRQQKTVVTSQWRNVKMYQRNIATKSRIKSRKWNAVKVMKAMHLMVAMPVMDKLNRTQRAIQRIINLFCLVHVFKIGATVSF